MLRNEFFITSLTKWWALMDHSSGVENGSGQVKVRSKQIYRTKRPLANRRGGAIIERNLVAGIIAMIYNKVKIKKQSDENQ
jgi:hypothetical protein